MIEKDKRMDFLFLAICLNISVILIFSFLPEKYFIFMEASYSGKLWVFGAAILVVLGDFDIMRNKDYIDDGFTLAKIRWVFALNLALPVFSNYGVIIIYFILTLVTPWLLLLNAIKFIFYGYYSSIRKWTKIVPFAILGVVELFLFILSSQSKVISEIHQVMYTLIINFPFVLLIYLSIRNAKEIKAFTLKKTMVRCIALSIIHMAITFSNLFIAYKISSLFIGCTSVIYIGVLIGFTFIFSMTLERKNEGYCLDKKYKEIMVGAFSLFAFIIEIIFKDMKITAIMTLSARTLIMAYEMAEGLYRQGDKFTRHKNAIFQYENEIRQNRRIMDFLHDDILQDLYAIKLLLENKNSGKDNEIRIEDLLEVLQKRIRNEMENYGVSIDKSLSYKENLDNMLGEIVRRYEKNYMEIYLECSDEIIVPQPYDGILYCMIRELVTNTFKHSNGSRCDIKLIKKNEKFYLEVKSDGNVHFENEGELFKRGFGLSFIRERVLSLGGTFDITRADKGGLMINVEL